MYLYKIHNILTPVYLRENLPLIRDQPSRRNSSYMYHDIACKTSRYKNSFFPDSIKSWNNIGTEFSSASSIGQFKKNIIDLIRPKPRQSFGIHDPVDLRYLFQLRVGLSPLKYHKSRHNFGDTPNDWCDCYCAPEDVAHFLFFCDRFSLPRIDLRSSVTTILESNNLDNLSEHIEIYLYGYQFLELLDNFYPLLLLSTIRYMKDTNRFS